jgi:hypothetical protein
MAMRWLKALWSEGMTFSSGGCRTINWGHPDMPFQAVKQKVMHFFRE